MRILTRILGFIDIGIGLVFLVVAAASMVSLPGKYSTYGSEPEDLYALVLYASVGIWFGATLLRVGWLTFKRVAIRFSTSPGLCVSLVVVVIILLALALLDISGPSDPGVYGLRYLLLAVAPVVLSYLLATSQKDSGRHS
jgi:hypothetical protein